MPSKKELEAKRTETLAWIKKTAFNSVQILGYWLGVGVVTVITSPQFLDWIKQNPKVVPFMALINVAIYIIVKVAGRYGIEPLKEKLEAEK